MITPGPCTPQLGPGTPRLVLAPQWRVPSPLAPKLGLFTFPKVTFIFFISINQHYKRRLGGRAAPDAGVTVPCPLICCHASPHNCQKLPHVAPGAPELPPNNMAAPGAPESLQGSKWQPEGPKDLTLLQLLFISGAAPEATTAHPSMQVSTGQEVWLS